MRTTKIIKAEADNALEEYRTHANSCEQCQSSPDPRFGDDSCSYGEFLYQEYDCLMDEYNAANEIFKQELAERNINDLISLEKQSVIIAIKNQIDGVIASIALKTAFDFDTDIDKYTTVNSKEDE